VAAFGTGDVAAILEGASAMAAAGEVPGSLHPATLPIAVAALLRSAESPAHGWLPEVMETPTPVSALLHAGIIDAGVFLLVRFADAMLLSAPSMRLLGPVGGPGAAPGLPAPVEAMTDVIAKHAAVRDLLDDGWLHLLTIGDDGAVSHRYARGPEWEPAAAARRRRPTRRWTAAPRARMLGSGASGRPAGPQPCPRS